MNSQDSICILGIDPGLRQTGWGIVEACGSSLTFVAAGTVASEHGAALADRLMQLHEGLTAIVHLHRPHEAAVETTFVSRDAVASLKLGHARGVALLVPAMAGMVVEEYAPNAIKKSVTGTGHGDKKQIQMMVRTLLPRATWNSEHAADALAVAICHAHLRNYRRRTASAAAAFGASSK